MKRTRLLAPALCLCLLVSGCAEGLTNPQPTSSEPIDEAAYYQTHNLPIKTLSESEVKVESPAGSILRESTVFIEYKQMNDETDQKGSIERLDYTTDVYEDGVTYEKYANIYLPHGYNPEDTETKYNVLYFQHGNTHTPEFFNYEEGRRWFDNLFASGKVEPVIVVFTTFYLYPDKEDEIRVSDWGAPAGDGNYEGVPANFWMEMTQDIIPAVESKYNTYAESFDEAGLIASREHRCFSGYSRGGFCTWYMFHHALPYFKWWSPMSGTCSAGRPVSDPPTDEEAYLYLKETIDANPDMDFFIYAGSGNYTDVIGLRGQIAYFERQDAFSYGSSLGENNLYYTVSNFAHGTFFAPYYFYNSLQILFSE